jgi:hypothetical protein
MLAWEPSLAAVSSAPDGPLRVGSRISKTTRGVRLTLIQEVVAFDRAALTRRERVVGGPFGGTTTDWSLVSSGAGTLLHCRVGVPGGVRSLLAVPLRLQVRCELANFKRLIEEEA